MASFFLNIFNFELKTVGFVLLRDPILGRRGGDGDGSRL